jgi:hypothetical protein
VLWLGGAERYGRPRRRSSVGGTYLWRHAYVDIGREWRRSP